MNFVNTAATFILGVVVSGLSLVGIQTPLTPPTLTLEASPLAIELGGSATIGWSSTGAVDCTSSELTLAGATSGSLKVSPSQTTTYTITCSKTDAGSQAPVGVWKEIGSDITDLWCTSNQPSFKNLYTENPCPSNSPEGQSCSEVSTLCAVNRWQTKGGTVGDLGSQQYCNLVSELYRCVPGAGASGAASSGVVSGGGTVFSGEFGDLVAPHLPYRAKLQQDTNENGGPFIVDGFYANKATADRVCSVLFPGSVNGSYRADKYKSPKNNTVLTWNGSRWTQQGARNANSHLRYAFTCVMPSSIATPTPTINTKSVSKSVTVTVLGATGLPTGGGGGGGGQCADGIDNDNDGRVDGNDLGCSNGGSFEAPDPQCSDGLDNNGNGLIDTADVAACSGPTDFNEVAPDASVSFTGPQLVQRESSATLTWAATNVKAGSCSISGNNGDRWSLSGSSGSVTSSPLLNETVFTFACTDLNERQTVRTVTVKIAPTFIEQ